MITAIKNRISFTKEKQLQLSIIIVNYNVKYFLEQCLASLTRAIENIGAEIFVVDNNSTDGSKDFFDGRFNTVQFIWNKENVGFSKANNLALKQCTGDYILFLNPDTILAEDCLDKCLRFLKQQHNTGALGIRMIDGSGTFLPESKRGFPSPLTSFFKLSGFTALFPRSKVFSQYYLGHLDDQQNHEVDVVAGAFMMMNKSVLLKTGGFDERFFMYGEDVDLSYRIQKAGFKNFYFAESTLIHFKGESTQKGSLTYLRLFYGAMGVFVNKHHSRIIAAIYHFIIQVAIGVKIIMSLPTSLFNKRPFKKTSVNNNPALIIADTKEFDYISGVLEKNFFQHTFMGRINPYPPGPPGKEDAIGILEDLPLLIKKHRATEIIFSANGFSIKGIIALIQHLPKHLKFRFHFANTTSIVSSPTKGNSGECIA